MRRVKRTWTTKSGKTVTKIYEYDTPSKKRGGKSLLLIGKSGRKYEDRIKEILRSIDDPGTKSQAKVIINNAIADKERLTIRSLTSKLAETKEEKFLLNMGYTRESFKEEYGFEAEEFLKEENWRIVDDKKIFMFGGVQYDIVQDYTSPVLVRR